MKNPLARLISAIGVVVLFLSFAVGPIVAKVQSWEQVPHDATGALFLVEKNQHTFHCTVENVAIDGKDVLATTARHCVWHDASTGSFFEDPHDAGWDYAPLAVSYSDAENAPYFDAVPVQISTTDDLAVIRVKDAAPQTTVALDRDYLVPGETVVTYGYPLDLGKLRFELQVVSPEIPHIPADVQAEVPEWSHGMLVFGNVAPGQSGSGIYDPKTHALAGVIVGHPSEAPDLGIVIPSPRIIRLLDGRDALGYVPPAPAAPAPETEQ